MIKDDFAAKWAMSLLGGVSDHCSQTELYACLKQCANCHYEADNRSAITSQFVGDLDGFIRFMEEKYQFLIRPDMENGKIYYDVNKDYCVCPIVESLDEKAEIPTTLCECSQFFCERMFSEVLQKPVSAKLVRSFLRDGKSCVYEISI